MGLEPILPVKVTITFDTMLNFNGLDFGVGTCEKGFNIFHISVILDMH